MWKYIFILFLILVIYLLAPSHCRQLADKARKQIGGFVNTMFFNAVDEGSSHVSASQIMDIDARTDKVGEPVVIENVSQDLSLNTRF